MPNGRGVDGEPEERGRRVGGWDHGSSIETWRGLGGGLFCCSVFMANLVMLFSSLTSRSYQCMSNFGIVSRRLCFMGAFVSRRVTSMIRLERYSVY